MSHQKSPINQTSAPAARHLRSQPQQRAPAAVQSMRLMTLKSFKYVLKRVQMGLTLMLSKKYCRPSRNLIAVTGGCPRFDGMVSTSF
jgi:hypothetical protein